MGIRFIIIISILLVSIGIANADYLIVSRSATIKKQPKGGSEILFRVSQDEHLTLLSSTQKNGYYYVNVPGRDLNGWIYRTLVRRYKDESLSSDILANTDNDLIVDVLDVGAGLCNVITLPNGKFIIYDAGHYRSRGNQTLKQIKEIIPPGSDIELMILSHTDADHIGAAGNIIADSDFRVKKLVHTGYEKSLISGEDKSATYKRLETSIINDIYPIEVINLYERDSIISPGITKEFGDVKLTYLCGFCKPLAEWNLSTNAGRINSVSIVVKLTYHGKSILLCGDAVGRHIGDPENEIIATEKFLVQNAGNLLNTDVLIAPHHGADNGNSKKFIEKTSPDYVIFSAGHEYNHPYQIIADRYLNLDPKPKMFRTDYGDDERDENGSSNEWIEGRINKCIDPYGDDNIRIMISENGLVNVRYTGDNCGCDE